MTDSGRPLMSWEGKMEKYLSERLGVEVQSLEGAKKFMYSNDIKVTRPFWFGSP